LLAGRIGRFWCRLLILARQVDRCQVFESLDASRSKVRQGPQPPEAMWCRARADKAYPLSGRTASRRSLSFEVEHASQPSLHLEPSSKEESNNPSRRMIMCIASIGVDVATRTRSDCRVLWSSLLSRHSRDSDLRRCLDGRRQVTPSHTQCDTVTLIYLGQYTLPSLPSPSRWL
jgi:hypothetical protein